MTNFTAISSIVLSLLFLPASTSWSQDSMAHANSLKPSSWALQFGISRDLTLSSFQGATISIKYHVTESNAWRIGLFVGGDLTNDNSASRQIQADTLFGNGSRVMSNKDFNTNLSLQYLWYIDPHAPVNLYLGAGPSFSYSFNRQDGDQATTNPGYYSTRTITNGSGHQWGVGIAGVVGVEWFAANWFSLHAQYGEALWYQWGSSSSTSTQTMSSGPSPSLVQTESASSKGWRLSNQSVFFGLSVYF